MLGFGDGKSTGRLYQRVDLPVGSSGVEVVGPLTLAVDPVRRICGLLVVASGESLADDVASVAMEVAPTSADDDSDPAWYSLAGWSAVTKAGETAIAIRELHTIGMLVRLTVTHKRAAVHPVRIEFVKIKG